MKCTILPGTGRIWRRSPPPPKTSLITVLHLDITTVDIAVILINMDANTSTATAGSSSTPVTVPLAPSKQGRTPGKAHKSAKSAKARSYISSAIKTPFEKRKEAENKRAAVKGVERDMKEEIEAEKERWVIATLRDAAR